jgi:hypothetical protein
MGSEGPVAQELYDAYLAFLITLLQTNSSHVSLTNKMCVCVCVYHLPSLKKRKHLKASLLRQIYQSMQRLRPVTPSHAHEGEGKSQDARTRRRGGKGQEKRWNFQKVSHVRVCERESKVGKLQFRIYIRTAWVRTANLVEAELFGCYHA